jgi:hypothetical protein
MADFASLLEYRTKIAPETPVKCHGFFGKPPESLRGLEKSFDEKKKKSQQYVIHARQTKCVMVFQEDNDDGILEVESSISSSCSETGPLLTKTRGTSEAQTSSGGIVSGRASV